MTAPFAEREPTEREVERLRLILSTYQDGSGMLARGSLPGWRDFERSVAAAFAGHTRESKYIYDVLLPATEEPGLFYGLDCKMRNTLSETDRKGIVTIEVSNASGRFWDIVKARGITQETYREHPQEVANAVLGTVEAWHTMESLENGGAIITAKSYYLTLQWNRRTGDYQLFQYPIQLPDPASLQWRADGRRVIGSRGGHVCIEWYGLSGGQLKYYPLVEEAIWASKRFKLEPLPPDLEGGLRMKAAAYFPSAWSTAVE